MHSGAFGILMILSLGQYTMCGSDSNARTKVQFFSVDGYELSRADQRTVEAIARSSVEEARKFLPKLPAEVTIRVQPGHEVIAETGETGSALQPDVVVWTVDPNHPGGVSVVAKSWLRPSLFHELHHLVRDAEFSRDSMLDVAVTEGMATAFERDFAHASVPWGQYPPEVRAWVDELRALPKDANRRAWVSRHPDGRRWVALKAGTYLVDRAVRASGKSAAELVSTPTDKVMQLASEPM